MWWCYRSQRTHNEPTDSWAVRSFCGELWLGEKFLITSQIAYQIKRVYEVCLLEIPNKIRDIRTTIAKIDGKLVVDTY